MITPFHIIEGQAESRILMVCDHASQIIPPALAGLGVGADALNSHVAWDIGAADVLRRLSEKWGAHGVLSGVSRLVVDCNRAVGAPGWMPAETCGVTVPGNHGLSEQDIEARANAWYNPYHQAVAQTINRLDRPVVLALHSFTPVMAGQFRPWHVGILWNQDGRLAVPIMAGLRKLEGIQVGDNQPYSGQQLNYTLDRHADSIGLPHVSIEIRQDLIADDEGVNLWAENLFQVLTPIFDEMGL